MSRPARIPENNRRDRPTRRFESVRPQSRTGNGKADEGSGTSGGVGSTAARFPGIVRGPRQPRRSSVSRYFRGSALIRHRLSLAQKFLVSDKALRAHPDEFLRFAVQFPCAILPVCRPNGEFGPVFLYLLGQKVAHPFQNVRLRRDGVQECFELPVDAPGGMALAPLWAGCRLADIIWVTLVSPARECAR
jgi:hypothetical protein